MEEEEQNKQEAEEVQEQEREEEERTSAGTVSTRGFDILFLNRSLSSKTLRSTTSIQKNNKAFSPQ